jgi:hypothetical protein
MIGGSLKTMKNSQWRFVEVIHHAKGLQFFSRQHCHRAHEQDGRDVKSRSFSLAENTTESVG